MNKELGAEYSHDGLVAGLTYFRNDYKNKIESGLSPVDHASGGKGDYANAAIYQWENVPKAVVEGLEGTLTLPLADGLKWSNNFTYMLQSKNKGNRRRALGDAALYPQLDARLAGHR